VFFPAIATLESRQRQVNIHPEVLGYSRDALRALLLFCYSAGMSMA
jgi:hypothetical protein